MEPVVELHIPPSLEFVALARLVVSSLAGSRRALDDEKIDDLKLAVSEACTNAIEARADRGVAIRCFESDDRLEVTVADQGSGFDISELPDQPPVTDPQRLEFERGLGIPLMRSLVDELDISSSDEGTSVRLTVLCPSAEPDVDVADLPV